MTTAQSVSFALHGTDETIHLDSYRAVVAGYTGRDPDAVRHHIQELAAIGVSPPPEVPMFYPVDADSVRTDRVVAVDGERTSGEVEPLYIRHAGRYYLGIASDHTDRHLEVEDIAASKQACPKPVAGTVVAVPNLYALSLDDCRARSWVDGRLYQDGPLSGLRTPAEVVDLLVERLGIGDDDFVCLGGTLPLIDGEFIYGSDWRIELTLPDGTTLHHQYLIQKGAQS